MISHRSLRNWLFVISEWCWGASWNKNGAFASGVTQAQVKSALQNICSKLNNYDYVERYYYWNNEAAISKVYNNKHMGSSEKTFMANSQSMAEELLKAQQQLAEETGMPSGLAGRIGHEIVERLTEQKQKSLTRRGYIRAGQGDDDSEE